MAQKDLAKILVCGVDETVEKTNRLAVKYTANALRKRELYGVFPPPLKRLKVRLRQKTACQHGG
jgi:hypothetical protein